MGFLNGNGQGLCRFCGIEVERVDHMLLLCKEFWKICKTMANSKLGEESDVVWWQERNDKRLRKKIWNAILMAAILVHLEYEQPGLQLGRRRLGVFPRPAYDFIKYRVAFWVKD